MSHSGVSEPQPTKWKAATKHSHLAEDSYVDIRHGEAIREIAAALALQQAFAQWMGHQFAAVLPSSIYLLIKFMINVYPFVDYS
jgi:hypothetical protein